MVQLGGELIVSVLVFFFHIFCNLGRAIIKIKDKILFGLNKELSVAYKRL